MTNLTINPLGEVFSPYDDYIAGTICITDLHEKLGREPTDDDFKAEFVAQLTDWGLTEDECQLVQLVWEAQEKFSDGRFNIYLLRGELRVVTEFKEFTDLTDAWKAIYATLSTIQANIEVIHQGPKLGYQDDPDYHRLTTQIEAYLTPQPTLEAISEAINTLRQATEETWNQAGVAVI